MLLSNSWVYQRQKWDSPDFLSVTVCKVIITGVQISSDAKKARPIESFPPFNKGLILFRAMIFRTQQHYQHFDIFHLFSTAFRDCNRNKIKFLIIFLCSG